jgi:hypothetical protein
MKVSFNWSDYLIPIVWKGIAENHLFDLFINSVLFENDETVSYRLTRIVVDLTKNNESLWRWELAQPALFEHFAVDVKLAQASFEIKANVVGSELAPQLKNLTAGPMLRPKDQAILRRFPIRFTTISFPEKVVIRAYSGSHLIGRNDIPLHPHSANEGFLFPVRGVWQVVNNFDNTLAHRQNASQEFAIDLVQISESGTVRRHLSMHPEDYICFGKPVRTIESGEVVACENGIPDNEADFMPSQSVFEQRIAQFGFTAGLGGNFVQIRHSENRWSFYAHLKQNSLMVKKGDAVSRGAILGEIGNSGHSTSAHLHLQLNDGEHPLQNRSIPLSFTNLRGVTNEPLMMITQNCSIVHSVD